MGPIALSSFSYVFFNLFSRILLTSTEYFSTLLYVSMILAILPGCRALPSIIRTTECSRQGSDGPLQINADCFDPAYSLIVYDSDTHEESPIPHRKISGHFNDSNVDFNIYLPNTGWDGRFFQLVYPLQNSTALDREISFGADSGGYTIRVAGTLGYSADAAIAKVSRDIARQHYQNSPTKIHGYIYGPSGGSLLVMAALENTFDVWNGGMAMVQATPASIPNNWCIRALGGLVLEKKAAQIKDSVRPGANASDFSFLNSVEVTVFEETTALGIPLAAWEDFEGVGQNRTTDLYEVFRTNVAPTVKASDPTYSDDFWGKSGYAGTEDSPLGSFFRQMLVDFEATVEQIEFNAEGVPIQVTLNVTTKMPTRHGLEFTLRSADGKRDIGAFSGTIDEGSKTVSIYPDSDTSVLSSLAKGTQLRVDNRWYLALHTYYRHQVPTRNGFYGYDILRNSDESPRYPQRSVLIAPMTAEGASGAATFSGNISAKLIVMDNLKDFDAFPWHADWYKNEVNHTLGNEFDDYYRLYYSDNANHFAGSDLTPASFSRVVDYTGLYEQLLRDLSAWVEQGTEPPKPTKYSVEKGQVSVPESASQRLGIQPVVELTVGGAKRVTIKAGSEVTFEARIETPPGAGSVVSTEWDYNGEGNYINQEFGTINPVVNLTVMHRYDLAGVYYPGLRVASQRTGNASTSFARALNLDRIRVIVE